MSVTLQLWDLLVVGILVVGVQFAERWRDFGAYTPWIVLGVGAGYGLVRGSILGGLLLGAFAIAVYELALKRLFPATGFGKVE